MLKGPQVLKHTGFLLFAPFVQCGFYLLRKEEIDFKDVVSGFRLTLS